MRVLFCTDQIYLHGGIEKVMAEKANYFADVLAYEVFILTTEQKGKEACYPLSAKISRIDIGINYHREKSYFHPDNFRKIPFHFKQWKRAIRSVQPDIIIVCNFAFDFYWIPFTFKKIPKLKEFHSSRFFETEDRNSATFIRRILFFINDCVESQFSRLVLLNPDEKKYYRSNNLEVIPNPITVHSNSQAALENKKALAAGRIAAVKGFEQAIISWKKVVEKTPEWELHIYGQGEPDYIASLQQLICTLELQDKVFLRPASAHFETVMLDYSIYIMTSLTECFPMVLLEALSIGLPIVSYDCPTGPRHIISQSEDGFLVENQNNEALSEKILLLTQSSILRKSMGKSAKQNSYRFSTATTMLSWQRLFNTITK